MLIWHCKSWGFLKGVFSAYVVSLRGLVAVCSVPAATLFLPLSEKCFFPAINAKQLNISLLILKLALIVLDTFLKEVHVIGLNFSHLCCPWRC